MKCQLIWTSFNQLPRSLEEDIETPDYDESVEIIRSILPAPRLCAYYFPKPFFYETFDISNGKIKTQPIPAPLSICSVTNNGGKHFRQYITII